VTVYVDNAGIPATVGRHTSRWSHLTADTKTELHTFAERLGLQFRWFQTCKDTKSCPPDECPHWHYDVTAAKRAQAVRMGAVEIDMRQLGDLIRRRRAAMREQS
jgi:hypothetical protein